MIDTTIAAFEPRLIASFRGRVSCQRDAQGPLGLTLIGRTHEHPTEVVSVAFSDVTPADMPETVEDITVERVGPNTYRIFAEKQEWTVQARAVHVHREIATAFYQVVVPRPARFTKRLFWRVILALAGNPTARRLLFALRRR